MTRRKNTRRFDPRYFMSEKTDIITEATGERIRPGDLDRQKFEEMAQVLRDDFADIIEKVEVLNIDNEEPAIPYAKVTFLNGAQKNYDDPIKMEQDISDLVHHGGLSDIDTRYPVELTP